MGLRRIASIKRKKNLPPSSAGKGRRFAMPIFMVINAIIISRLPRFFDDAAEAVTSAITFTVPTGPASSDIP